MEYLGSRCFVGAMNEEPFKLKTEVVPLPVCHGVETVRRGFKTSHTSVNISEILQYASELGAQPQRTCLLSVYKFENEDAPCLLRVETSAFYHTNQSIGFAVAVHIACAEAVNGVGQAPVIEEIERVVGLGKSETIVRLLRLATRLLRLQVLL